jgi:hypothetical protein
MIFDTAFELKEFVTGLPPRVCNYKFIDVIINLKKYDVKKKMSGNKSGMTEYWSNGMPECWE